MLWLDFDVYSTGRKSIVSLYLTTFLLGVLMSHQLLWPFFLFLFLLPCHKYLISVSVHLYLFPFYSLSHYTPHPGIISSLVLLLLLSFIHFKSSLSPPFTFPFSRLCFAEGASICIAKAAHEGRSSWQQEIHYSRRHYR